MGDKLEEVKKDIAELEQILSQANRQKVKDILSIEIKKLVTQATLLEETNKLPTSIQISENQTTNRFIDVKLNNYAWDQSSKFMKFYVTLQKVQTIQAENITCTFTNKSFLLNVKALENKNYNFTIKNLLYNIDPTKSSWKVKTDMVLIMCAKEKEQNWSHVTELEKKASDHKKLVPDKMDDSKDPGESLMNMMKKMYETGDDEMKRTIAKAWVEGQQNKQNSVNLDV